MSNESPPFLLSQDGKFFFLCRTLSDQINYGLSALHFNEIYYRLLSASLSEQKGGEGFQSQSKITLALACPGSHCSIFVGLW